MHYFRPFSKCEIEVVIDQQPREVWVDERGTNCGVQDHIENDGVYDELDVCRGSAAGFGAHAPPKLKRNLLF